MIFNLLPIPPLDGSKVLFAFLPPRLVLAVAAGPRAVRVRADPPAVLPAAPRWLHRRPHPLPDHRCVLLHPGGSLRSASSARTCGPRWARRSARDWRLAQRTAARALRRDARRRSAPRAGRRRDAARGGRDRPRGAARRAPARRRQGADRGLAAGRVLAGGAVRARGSGASRGVVPGYRASLAPACATTPRHRPCWRPRPGARHGPSS